ncbi:hypothetical protein GUJ93_ZPchr0009g851 [Zizania palustris]|uniref:Uncharacterized protein n=1 Tax=Zizania palustris TaxID=103762 RepID=A0A8J5VLL5_ZIZPA|nr:hypothetical protein GUJ93_ZPchr0009g851 [Zizania palustris]
METISAVQTIYNQHRKSSRRTLCLTPSLYQRAPSNVHPRFAWSAVFYEQPPRALARYKSHYSPFLLAAAATRPAATTAPPIHRHLRPPRSATTPPICHRHWVGRLPRSDGRRRLRPPPGHLWSMWRRQRPRTDLRVAREPLPSGPRSEVGYLLPFARPFSFLEERDTVQLPGLFLLVFGDGVQLSHLRPSLPIRSVKTQTVPREPRFHPRLNSKT